MGTCYETRADRTRFIIDEDFKIKQELIRAIQKSSKIHETQIGENVNEKVNGICPKKNIPMTYRAFGNREKIINENKRTLKDEYNILGPLGEGGYGEVYLVSHKKMKLKRAMKVIPVNSKNEEEKTDEEIELLKNLDHPNIVKLFEYFCDSEKYYLITEYCKGGDLFDLIKAKKVFSESSAAYIMYQIFRALIYCHYTHHLIHRDIKPENIVVYRQNSAGEDLYDVKLIDFGISKIFNKSEKTNDNKVKGSLNYIAPEVIKHSYDEKCDIWSCGVILYILVIGKYPFNGKDKDDILNRIEHGSYSFPNEFTKEASPEIQSLIHQCLNVNPSERISAKEALNHPFFNSYQTKEYFIHVTESFLNKTINNIKKYEINNNLQELTFTYIVHNYPDQDEINLINRVFSKFNTKNDGKMNEEELKKGLLKYLYKGKKSKDVAEKEANAIFHKLDKNGNGYIECEEFVRAGIDKKLLKNKDVLEFTFNFLDKDRNGEISVEELKEVFGVVDEKDEKALVDLLKSIDTDLNGQISFDEYYNMMLKIIDGLI